MVINSFTYLSIQIVLLLNNITETNLTPIMQEISNSLARCYFTNVINGENKAGLYRGSKKKGDL